MADELHPVQINDAPRAVPREVTERAYEVYSGLYGTSQSLQRLNERCGFGVGELIAFLYARSFPREQWSVRVDEAFRRAAPKKTLDSEKT
jgi:hypothetical protein